MLADDTSFQTDFSFGHFFLMTLYLTSNYLFPNDLHHFDPVDLGHPVVLELVHNYLSPSLKFHENCLSREERIRHEQKKLIQPQV